jgi:hypothetical protein
MQLVSDTDAIPGRLSALYVGLGLWSLPWLRGRTVSTPVAVAAIQAGEALRSLPEGDDPVWREIHSGAAQLGISARDLAAVVGVTCVIPDAAPARRRTNLWVLCRRSLRGGRR